MKPFYYLTQLIILLVNTAAAGQTDHTIIYMHAYGVSFSDSGNAFISSKEEALYINNDSICFYEFLYNKNNKNMPVIGEKDSHHAIFTLLHTKRYFYEFAISRRHLEEDTMNKRQWKLVADSMKICGYTCYKAVADQVIAWYTPAIKAASGPAYYCGLPGLILQINDPTRNWLITANTIVNEAPQIRFPKKMKIVRYKASKGR